MLKSVSGRKRGIRAGRYETQEEAVVALVGI